MTKTEELALAYKELAMLRQRAAAMEEALRKYADRFNWKYSGGCPAVWVGPGDGVGHAVAQAALSVLEHCTEEPSQKSYDPERTEGGPYGHRTFVIPAIEHLKDGQRRTCELTITMNAVGQVLGFEVSNVGYEQTQVA